MVPLSYYLVLGGILFVCGVLGFLIKRNIITIFMSIELMLNGVNQVIRGDDLVPSTPRQILL